MFLADESQSITLLATTVIDQCDVLIYVKDLHILLKDVWEIYHPCGIQLDEQHINEILESFREWSVKYGQIYTPSRKNVNSGFELSVRFTQFQHMFILMCEDIVNYLLSVEQYEIPKEKRKSINKRVNHINSIGQEEAEVQKRLNESKQIAFTKKMGNLVCQSTNASYVEYLER